jgi:DNA recombination protein RmuC
MAFSALDFALIAAALGIGLGAGFAVLLAARRSAGGVGAGVAELTGQLKQMTDAQAAANTQLAERLQAQERALAATVDQRLSLLANKVGEQLDKSAKETTTTVGELRERLVRIDAAQKQLGDLGAHMVELRDILSNKQARGAFGEVMLEDLVRQVLPRDYYDFQCAVGEGRADCLLKLPNPPGSIVVDAKFPLESWRVLAAAGDDAQRRQAERIFATAMTKHIMDIRDKYIVPGETGEQAMMFLPSEAIYAELHTKHPEIVERSYKERVFIVSPTTMWALLNTVRAVLKDVRMREQAGVIQVEVGRLLEDIGRLDKRVESLQTHFAQAEKDIREIGVSSGKVSARAERIGEVELSEDQQSAQETAQVTDIAAARALGSPKAS